VESEICFQDGSCKRRRWHQKVSRKVPGTCFVLPASALSPNRPLLTEDPCCAWCLAVGVTGWRPWKWESGPRSAAPLHPIPQWGVPAPMRNHVNSLVWNSVSRYRGVSTDGPFEADLFHLPRTSTEYLNHKSWRKGELCFGFWGCPASPGTLLQHRSVIWGGTHCATLYLDPPRPHSAKVWI
jgi:hypothetical protein